MDFFQTERLIVRRFEAGDADGLFDYFNEPRVNCFQDEKLNTLEEAKIEVESRSWKKSQLAVCLKEDNKIIGNLFAEEENDTYNVGWNFNPKFGGKGFATEAATGLFRYLFTKKSTRRIYCYVEEDNTPSQKLCKRLGMRKEGLFSEYISFVNNEDGTPKYENTLQFAILKKEWQKETK